MFERKDYIEYFNQLIDTQIKAAAHAQDLYDALDDEESKILLAAFIDAKKNHIILIKKILQMTS